MIMRVRVAFKPEYRSHSDKQRMGKRPVFIHWVEEYIVAHPGRTAEEMPSKEEVLREALDRFGKHEEYRAVLNEWKAAEKEKLMWINVARSLPLEGRRLGLAI